MDLDKKFPSLVIWSFFVWIHFVGNFRKKPRIVISLLPLARNFFYRALSWRTFTEFCIDYFLCLKVSRDPPPHQKKIDNAGFDKFLLILQGLFSRITFREPVFLGGTGNITGMARKLPVNAGLIGCVRKFIANEHEYEFNISPSGDVNQGFDVRKYQAQENLFFSRGFAQTLRNWWGRMSRKADNLRCVE